MFLSWQLNDVWCGWVRGMHHGNVYKSILKQILTGLNSEPHQATRRIDKSWSKNHWLKKVSSFWTQILFKCNRNVSISQADKTWYSVCTHIICKNNFTCLSVVRVHVSGLPEGVGERRPLSSSPDIRASVVGLAFVCNLGFIHEHCKRLMDNASDRPCVFLD